MAHCCGGHTEDKKQKIVEPEVQNKKTKDFVKKYLHKLDKKRSGSK